MARFMHNRITSLLEQINVQREFTEDQKKRYLACFTQRELQESPLDVFRWFLAVSRLPHLYLGLDAPPLMMNKLLDVQPAPYRLRFQEINPRQLTNEGFANMTLKFCSHVLPARESLAVPETDSELAVGEQVKVFPVSSFMELDSWFINLPFYTLTRVMHMVCYEDLAAWHVFALPLALHVPPLYHSNEGPKSDSEIWRTYVYRRPPPGEESDFFTYYEDGTLDSLGDCRVVFAVQPPWILSEDGVNAFLTTSKIPPYNDEASMQYDSGQRIWAMLWDECARRGCRHWVLSNYHTWIFGIFSRGYSAGQVLYYTTHDSYCPTVLQCLVFHVASALNISEHPLIQYYEPEELLNTPLGVIPPAVWISADTEQPDSDSGPELDGMDVEVAEAFAAGASEHFMNRTVSACPQSPGGPSRSRPPQLRRKAKSSLNLSNTKQMALNRKRSVPGLSRKKSTDILAWSRKVDSVHFQDDVRRNHSSVRFYVPRTPGKAYDEEAAMDQDEMTASPHMSLRGRALQSDVDIARNNNKPDSVAERAAQWLAKPIDWFKESYSTLRWDPTLIDWDKFIRQA